MADHPDPFGWHPEPGLLDIRDEQASRPALERLGSHTWAAALDYIYGEGLRRGMGEPAGADALREVFFGPAGGPSPAPVDPRPAAEVIDAFSARMAPHMLNAWHPRVLSYFTPSFDHQ